MHATWRARRLPTRRGGEGTTINFAHKKAIMTIQFTSEERPHQMVFTHMYDTNDNLSYIYTINYSDIKPVDGLYTSHIMIDPVAHDPFNAYSNLTFELYDTEGDIYDCRIRKNVETTYLAGNRYTAPIKDLDRTGWPAWVGDGSEETPYEISSATMLCKVSRATSSDTDGDFEEETSHYLSAYYKVTADIELGDESFSSIASNTYFRGSFDGGGHTISGLTTTLFEGLSGATIERVTVKGTGADRAGVAKTALEETTIDDCHNYIPITGSNDNIGGIVYKCQSSTISNCTNHATVNGGSNDFVGGVVGYFTSSTIYNCINYGAVSGSSKVGGVIGESTTDKCYIYNCSNHGAVVGENNYIGGVVGDANNSTITNCYNSAKVASDINNSESKNVGGVVGYIDSSTLLNCYNLAEIEGYNLVGGVAGSLTSSSQLNNCHSDVGIVIDATSTYTSSIGGVVGYYTDGTITNCSNRNSLKASSCWDIGGVVGELKGNIEGCYNSGRLQGLYNVGGIVGLLSSDNSTISNCYNSNLVSASINGYVTTSKPTAGGIVGSTNNATNCTIKYCYSRETITSSIADYNGGIMGFSYENNSVINCYYLDGTASGIMSSAYDYDISITSSGSVNADTLKNTATLDALNAGDTGAWSADSSAINNGYPVLSWQK